MKALFARLDACPHVDVHIISGRDADFLSLHFDAYGFTLVEQRTAPSWPPDDLLMTS